jgi:hypothetical protein
MFTILASNLELNSYQLNEVKTMGKSVHDDVLDAALNHIRAQVKLMTACTGEPTTYAQATSTGQKECARCTGMTSGVTYFSALGNATGGGRVVTVQQVSTGDGTSITRTATANHVALCSVTGTKLLYVTTCTSQALTTGNDITFNAWNITIDDPT